MRLLVLVVLVCAAVMVEGRRGRNKKERKERVWHVATAEEECGKSAQMNEGHPTDMCTEVTNQNCSRYLKKTFSSNQFKNKFEKVTDYLPQNLMNLSLYLCH